MEVERAPQYLLRSRKSDQIYKEFSPEAIALFLKIMGDINNKVLRISIDLLHAFHGAIRRTAPVLQALQ